MDYFRELVSRREAELDRLIKTKTELESQLGNFDHDNTRLRDVLKAEQQAHHICLSEKKDVIKQNKRAMDEIRRYNITKPSINSNLNVIVLVYQYL